MSQKIKPKRNKKYVPKQVIQSSTIQRKTFDYKLGGVNLNFSLRIDIKTELQEFKNCMLKAIEDIDVELEKLKK